MLKNIKYILFISTLTLSTLLSACGSGIPQDATIQTAVAQTVAAQEAAYTETPSAPPTELSLLPTTIVTPFVTVPSPTLPVNPSKSDCAKASLDSETIPDGTIYKPGELFTKTWQITNTSTCVWDTNYKIVFWSGDILGGAYVYNLPQVTGPGVTLPISLVLTAPAVDGRYKSEWALQTPDKINFGVGMYSEPFYTTIVVSSSAKPAYAVTSVDYSVVRNPATGCPLNTRYRIYATFTTNGPLEFTFQWQQSDGNSQGGKGTIKMKEAGTKTVSREWMVQRGNSLNDRWMSMTILAPDYKEYPPAIFSYDCIKP
ncbi:MAG: NBR1-Ig-like domain-containing protein [Chloroflexi bacterium]|nr:NBR1-Ig-like domain-containing protein [Chloroflexota bacterium]